MSSPAVGFSSWRRSPRRSSSVSQYASAQEEIESSSSSTTIPTRPGEEPTGNEGHQLYSTSVNSVAHREPLRSFIHGSVRGNLGTTGTPHLIIGTHWTDSCLFVSSQLL